MSSDLAVYEPKSISEAFEYAKILVASRLLPKHVTTPEAAIAIMATGRELGLSTMQALRAIFYYDGRVSLSADLMAAIVSRSSVCEYFMLVSSDATASTYSTKRVGHPKETALTYTIEQAKAAGLVSKDNWKKYPDAMLRARCISALCRIVYADVTLGLYTPEELEPIDDSSPPVPPARTSEIVVREIPERSPESQETSFAVCEGVLRAARTPEQLKHAAKMVQDAVSGKHLSTAQIAALKGVYKHQAKVIADIHSPLPEGDYVDASDATEDAAQ